MAACGSSPPLSSNSARRFALSRIQKSSTAIGKAGGSTDTQDIHAEENKGATEVFWRQCSSKKIITTLAWTLSSCVGNMSDTQMSKWRLWSMCTTSVPSQAPYAASSSLRIVQSLHTLSPNRSKSGSKTAGRFVLGMSSCCPTTPPPGPGMHSFRQISHFADDDDVLVHAFIHTHRFHIAAFSY